MTSPAAFVAFLDVEVIGASSTGFTYCGRVANASSDLPSWCSEALVGYATFVWVSVGIAVVAAVAAIVILVKTPRY